MEGLFTRQIHIKTSYLLHPSMAGSLCSIFVTVYTEYNSCIFKRSVGLLARSELNET